MSSLGSIVLLTIFHGLERGLRSGLAEMALATKPVALGTHASTAAPGRARTILRFWVVRQALKSGLALLAPGWSALTNRSATALASCGFGQRLFRSGFRRFQTFADAKHLAGEARLSLKRVGLVGVGVHGH